MDRSRICLLGSGIGIGTVSVFVGIAMPLLSLATSAPLPASGLVLTQTLSIGMTGPQVVVLQQILNSDPATEVAQNGPGSPGHESDYFGAKTKAAVKSFQSKYPTQILVPAGLTSPSGYVGQLTLRVLNAVAGNLAQNAVSGSSDANTPASTDSSVSSGNLVSGSFPQDQINASTPSVITTKYQSIFPSNMLRVFQVSPFQNKPGSVITLSGSGFATVNDVHIGDGITIPNISSVNVAALNVTLPSNISEGQYEVWVTNINGTSRKTNFPIYLTISNDPKSAPHISSISPQTVSSLGQTVTIVGTGFTANNTVVSPLGLVKGLSSANGTTLTFTLSQLSGIANLTVAEDKAKKDNLPDYEVRVLFAVSNENGESDNTGGILIQQ